MYHVFLSVIIQDPIRIFSLYRGSQTITDRSVSSKGVCIMFLGVVMSLSYY